MLALQKNSPVYLIAQTSVCNSVYDCGIGKQTGQLETPIAFVLSNSNWGNGELRVKFRQHFDLIAFGTTELKQKKAAGVGSDDLYQFKYTPQDSNL